ncbi:MAG: IS30 family transposase, partial [candidate division WOR-3 bacterium]
MHMSRYGKNISQIALELGWDKSTISRELRRNRDYLLDYYWDENAQIRADRRRRAASRRYRLRSERIRDYVREKLKAGWSPELISGRIELDLPGCSISHEAIYQYIYHLAEPERSVFVRYLRRHHRRRRKRGTGKAQRKSRIPNRISIEERPEAVASRRQMGHWEGDSLVSSHNTTVLYSLVERKTRLMRLTRIRGRDGKRTAAAIAGRLGPLPVRARRTLTLDNGPEHTGHEKVTETIGTMCYFCDPYSAWQRGTCENRNGLVRYYFPKGTDFARLTQAEIERVEHAINTRPMKCLGFKT